ncbi:uncharacterized protein METZ01_LOCUS401873, partial [marine metagenome]
VVKSGEFVSDYYLSGLYHWTIIV